jgi:hypothetical protein
MKILSNIDGTERTARAVHLGVMVGFAVVAPNFKPEEQDQGNLQTMCMPALVFPGEDLPVS